LILYCFPGYPVAAPPVMPPMGPPGYLAPPGTLPEPPGTGKHGLDDDEPSAKRARTEDSLVPEQDFLARQKVIANFINTLMANCRPPALKSRTLDCT